MEWWQEGLMTLITGSLLIVLRIWLEMNWKNKK